MKASINCINLIKKFEGCRLAAYRCPAGVWTIGYGHTAGVKEGDKISLEQAESFLRYDLKIYEMYVSDNVSFELTQNQFDALVSFTYNCGLGNLRKLTAKRSAGQIADAMTQYNKSGGKILKGLVLRREAEKALFLAKS